MGKMFVTGHKGFIGKNLVKELEKFDNVVKGWGEWHEIFYIDQYFEVIDKLNEFKPDVIFHVGACANTLNRNVNYMMFYNFEATRLLMKWAHDNHTPLIYSSSASSYGVNGFYPCNLYGWSKYSAEQYVLAMGGIALRYFNVYGPGEELKGNMSSVAYQMYLKQKNNEEILLFPGNPTRDFVYVQDVVNANIQAYLNYGSLPRVPYDVGSGESRSFEDVLNLMGIEYQYHTMDKIPQGYQFHTCANKKCFLPKWTPKFTLEDGIKEYKSYLDGI